MKPDELTHVKCLWYCLASRLRAIKVTYYYFLKFLMQNVVYIWMELSGTMDMPKLKPRTWQTSKFKTLWNLWWDAAVGIATRGLHTTPMRSLTLTLNWQVTDASRRSPTARLYYTSVILFIISKRTEFWRKTIWSNQDKSGYAWDRDSKYWTSPSRKSATLMKGQKVIKIQE